MRLARHVFPALVAGCVAACGSGSPASAPAAGAEQAQAAAPSSPGDRAASSTSPSVELAASPRSTPGGVSTADPPADPPSAAGPSTGTDSLATVEARLDQVLSAASHCTADAECRSVAVGGKACGGPTGYRAYSTKLADPAAVEALARQDHALAMQAERDAHRVSNCMFLADPGAHCVKQRCETGTAGDLVPPRGDAATR